MKKKCTKCGVIKGSSEFHSTPLHKDGLSSYCRPCKRNYDNERQATWYRERKNENNRRYTASDRVKKLKHDYYVSRRRTHALENKARSALSHAVRDGKLTPGPCMICGIKKVDGHHHRGYAKAHWLDVVWLCRMHHIQAHRGMVRIAK